jgi:hypothetical protein
MRTCLKSGRTGRPSQLENPLIGRSGRQPSPLAIRASASAEQRIRRPLAIRDRRRCERRGDGRAASKRRQEHFVPDSTLPLQAHLPPLNTKPGRWSEEQRPGYTEVSLRFDGLGMDDDFYKQHAQRVRDLAEGRSIHPKAPVGYGSQVRRQDRQAERGIEDDRAADSRASRPNPPLAQTDIGAALPSGSAAPPFGGLEAEPRFCFAARRINPSPPQGKLRPMLSKLTS